MWKDELSVQIKKKKQPTKQQNKKPHAYWGLNLGFMKTNSFHFLSFDPEV